MNTRGRNRAVASVQLVVLVSILILVLGIAVPVITSRVETAARAQTLSDVRRIAGDVLNYAKDTDSWPAGCSFAFTDGDAAFGEANSFGKPSAAAHLSTFLVTNKPAVNNWQGPYMSLSRPDPWGRRYVVVLDDKRDGQCPHGWVISAGPDGVFQTCKDDRELQADDLGVLLR